MRPIIQKNNIIIKDKSHLMNRKKILNLTPFFLLLILLSSCSIIGGIFKAGVWVGVIGIVIILIIIIWLVSKATKK